MKKVLFFAACLFAMVFVSSCSGSTPADEALKCVELMQKGDYETLVEELKMKESTTPEEIAEVKEMFVALGKDKGTKQIEAKGGISSYKVVEETISEDGQKANVKVEITYGNGEIEVEEYNMELVDGDWKICLDK